MIETLRRRATGAGLAPLCLASLAIAASGCAGPVTEQPGAPAARGESESIADEPGSLRPAKVAAAVESLGYAANGPGEAAADRLTSAMFFVDIAGPADGLADFILLVERRGADVRIYTDPPAPPFAQSLPPTSRVYAVRNVVVIDQGRDADASSRLRQALEER